jgi:protein-tyrosine-phosphatase
MSLVRTGSILLLLQMWMALAGCTTNDTGKHAAEPASVLMVCEHGSVKSLMAASLFNQGAAERHLPLRAIARGVTPDPAVPPLIADALEREGFHVKQFVPTKVSAADVAQASRVIAIGVEPAVLSAGADVSIDTWSDVPAASESYSAARASLKRHVDALLTELQQHRAD